MSTDRRRTLAYVTIVAVFTAACFFGFKEIRTVEHQGDKLADVAVVTKRLACLQGSQTAGASHIRQKGAKGAVESTAHWRNRLINQRNSLIFAALQGGCGPAFQREAEHAVVQIEHILAAIATHPNPGPVSRIMHEVQHRAEAELP